MCTSASLLVFHLPVSANDDKKAVTGRTVAKLKVHTKKFYGSEEWKEISSSVRLWSSQKSPRMSALNLALTREAIYGHVNESFSLCAQTRKHPAP